MKELDLGEFLFLLYDGMSEEEFQELVERSPLKGEFKDDKSKTEQTRLSKTKELTIIDKD